MFAGAIVLGLILIIIQFVSLIGTISSGGFHFFENVTSTGQFFFDLLGCVGYFIVGLIGVFVIVIAFVWKKQVKKEKEESIPKNGEKKVVQQTPSTRWQFRIKFEDGTHQKKQVTLSEKDYKRICDIFDEEIPLNGSTDLEGILQSVKKQLEEKLGRKITSIGFCDENYD